MNFSHRKVAFIWIASILLLSAVFYYFILMKQNEEQVQLNHAYNLEQKKFNALKEKLTSQEDSVPVAKLKTAIPTNMEDGQLIKLMNDASTSSDVTVVSYEYLERNEELKISESLISQSIQINGEAQLLSQLYKFLKEIESSKRLINIHSFNYQDREEYISFQIQIEAYANEKSPD